MAALQMYQLIQLQAEAKKLKTQQSFQPLKALSGSVLEKYSCLTGMELPLPGLLCHYDLNHKTINLLFGRIMVFLHPICINQRRDKGGNEQINQLKMEVSDDSIHNKPAAEIVFFDLETTVPNRAGQRFWVLEFGAIVVCPRKLVELESYSTLIRPTDLSAVALRSGRSEGITREVVAGAPGFEEVADKIFSILNGRVWAGHNIQRFDCVRIKEAFARVGRPAPVPVGIIDSLGVLSDKFGRRAGNMKMASLATYFGLGQQKHRSLDDVRMNLEVLKHCATVLFLESSLPTVLTGKWRGSTAITTRSRSNGKLMCREESSRKSPTSSPGYQRAAVPYARGGLGKMTERVKNILCKAHEQPALSNILKHSHSLLR